MKKIINFFKSWEYFDLKPKNDAALVGYQGEDLLSYFNSKNINLNITEKISKELISLPIYPGLSLQNQKKVLKLINTFS